LAPFYCQPKPQINNKEMRTHNLSIPYFFEKRIIIGQNSKKNRDIL
jgi:hypothetical protein